jgi:hypothetical protein
MDKNKEHNQYFCELCNFKSKNKAKYIRHLNTKKHILTNLSLDNKKDKKGPTNLWCCVCGKSYKFQSGLCKHKLKCNFLDTSNNTPINDLNNIVQKVITENKEFKNLIIEQQNKINSQQQQLLEILPKLGNNVNNNTINQKFNINIFLNENCKNAINMSDFINSLKISFKELDTISTSGLACGLSTAIINNIQRLKIEDRPIHCTDVKRETLYIKDNNEWACDVSHQSIKKAIKIISGKPFFALQEWREDNPQFMDDERKQDYFAKALQAIGKSNIKVDDKIVKAICNHTYLKR